MWQIKYRRKMMLKTHVRVHAETKKKKRKLAIADAKSAMHSQK